MFTNLYTKTSHFSCNIRDVRLKYTLRSFKKSYNRRSNPTLLRSGVVLLVKLYIKQIRYIFKDYSFYEKRIHLYLVSLLTTY